MFMFVVIQEETITIRYSVRIHSGHFVESSEIWDTTPPLFKGYKYGDSPITGIPNRTLSMCARDFIQLRDSELYTVLSKIKCSDD